MAERQYEESDSHSVANAPAARRDGVLISAVFALCFDGVSQSSEQSNVSAQSNSRPLASPAAATPSGTGLRLIAVFEATKGLLVMVAGLGLLSLLHRDVEVLAEEIVERGLLIHHVRLSGVLLRAAENVTDRELWSLASIALAYSAVRFIEAYGLWPQREWGQWFALLSGILYLPWEILAIVHHATAVRYILLLFNGALIACLAWMRYVKTRPGS